MTSKQLPLLPELAGLPDHPIRGLLPSQMLEEMVASRKITASAPISSDQIQPSSLDLRLGSIAYRVGASFLPGNRATVPRKLESLTTAKLDLSQPALLEKGAVYIIPLQEELALPDDFSAKGNPKSTTGRLDIFTRLITDYGERFEQVRSGYRGRLYAEVVPLTFPIIVREGARLSQLRITYKHPQSSYQMLINLNEREPIVYQDEAPAEPLVARYPAERRHFGSDLRLTVDLNGVEGSEIVGYEAKKGAPPIDIALVNHYDVREYWKPVFRNSGKSIILGRDDFYILMSKERVNIPPDYAAEMWPLDPTIGEFRIHYAGFFDPGFGWSSDEELKGSHAVLEVRSHDVPSLLEDGQEVARLVYERLLEVPTRLYGRDIGSSYQAQHLTLSKHFRKS
jgi:dCTP deaminase